MLNYSYPQIVVTEIPDEISLALSISGCPLRCPNCHSKETYPNDFGKQLDSFEMERLLDKNKLISCVLFYGGEWDKYALINLLNIVKNRGYKTALYTGLEVGEIPRTIYQMLDYIKVGSYIEELGTLRDSNTNQRLIELATGKDITYKFRHMEVRND